MLLAVAVGNTNIHLGVFAGTGDHAVLVRDWRIHTDPYLTADELELLIRGLLGPDLEQVTAVAALSTVPSLLRELRGMVDKYFGGGPHVLLEPGCGPRLPLLVDNPKVEDRPRRQRRRGEWQFSRVPSIVVAFGTATVVDAVSAKEFSVAIAPG